MAMDVKQVNFYVLDVGQGACNYVEIVNSANVVTYNMLVDIGTNSSQTVATKNIEWLKARISPRPNPKINVILLTHGDNDHYNLMLKLLPALGDPTHEQVGMVRYGGVAWRYKIGNTEVITRLKAYTVMIVPDLPSIPYANVLPLAQLQTDYKADTATWGHIWPDDYEAGDVSLRLILANTPHPADGTINPKNKRANAEAVNSKSIVFGVHWAGQWYVGTGDATATTMASVNTLFGDFANIPPTLSLTMPHHGSRKTTYDLKAASDIPGDEAVEVVERFLYWFHPSTVTISADIRPHHHPSLLMIKQFVENTSTDPIYWHDDTLEGDRHYITSWVDYHINEAGADVNPARWQYMTTQTAANVYCTRYYDGDRIQNLICPPSPATDAPIVMADEDDPVPPRGRNWNFAFSGGINLVLTSTPNTIGASTLRMIFHGAPARVLPSRSAGARLAALRHEVAQTVWRTPSPRAAARRWAEPSLAGLKAVR